MDEQRLINLMQDLIGGELPALRNKGRSSDIRIVNKTIYFIRGKSKESVKIAYLISAFNMLKENKKFESKEFDDNFKYHFCSKTFFFQLLKYFNYATVEPKGNTYLIYI